MRWSGPGVWRPGPGLRIAWLVIGVLFVSGTTWLYLDGEVLSDGDVPLFAVSDLVAVVVLPVVLLRWRLVLTGDELVRVFFRIRRIPLREVVDARNVSRQGLTFVCADGRELTFGGVANSAWGHRRTTPTRADLVARAVLSAAATAQGEEPPVDYRLPPMTGLKQEIIEQGIVGGIVGGIVAFFRS
ncbi:hypothetical protein GCM10023066_53100 [Nocardioides kongjuensis]